MQSFEEPNFVTGEYSYPDNIEDLVKNVTKEAIFSAFKYKTVDIDMEDITFDIPADILSMYCATFAAENPIRIVPYPDKPGEFRHIIYFATNMILVAFSIKNSQNKLYGFTFCDTGDKDDDNCTLFEFTGNPMIRYEFRFD